jgi:caffeoyl-CoA O-methyltransferase
MRRFSLTLAVLAVLAVPVTVKLVATAGAQPPGDGARRGGAIHENPLLPKDDEEGKILEALTRMRQGPRYANVSEADGRLLRLLTEAVNAKHVVEIGTSTGESGVWFALALRKTGGKLTTHEINPQRAKIAEDNFKTAGVDHLITVVVGDAHETITRIDEPIDIIFLDANPGGYIDYIEKLLPKLRPGGLLIAHNMRSPAPNPDYIKAITTDPNLETSFLLMEASGIGVTLKKR